MAVRYKKEGGGGKKPPAALFYIGISFLDREFI